mmetsp:Transcript_60170/g.82486  ORF Transcript_60170/g.82486 Transcript_60170/m.82486 type:complete len:283 (-) Transcript_60170:364-1212(-)|eukprot:CAMPEP_0185767766 /NCGR_PEP_ID=MMETSP1174-20130828/45543_1 /TAXON_ID=35687 /ORGANISM="Dictyocha speculum, Strain CCMP1381" /LENGTH=282 /DNA_ID=CAMNT_0028452111 /DNA_START=14 /DNA_END=862 /DNA_ORIENTATION=+
MEAEDDDEADLDIDNLMDMQKEEEDNNSLEAQLIALKKENALLRRGAKLGRNNDSRQIKNRSVEVVENNGSRNETRRNASQRSDGKQSDLGSRTLQTLNDSEGRVVWVGSEDTSQTVSFSIVGASLPNARRAFPVQLFAKNEANVNTAAKGVAIAYDKLKNKGVYVGAEISFRDQRNELTYKIVELQNPSDPSGHDVLTVARKTDFRILAGAVAKNLRDDRDIVLRAIGPTAVFIAARSIALTAEYLAAEEMDYICVPFFTKIQFEGRDNETTCLDFALFNL